MAEERFSPVAARFIAPVHRQALPPTAVVIVFIGYLLLNLGCVLLMADSLILSIMGIVTINLLLFLFLWPEWCVPLYILIAGPSIALPLGAAGILSRLFAGNLFFALVVVIGLVRTMVTRSPDRLPVQELSAAHAVRSNSFTPLRQQALGLSSLMVPLFALVLVGLASIIHSRLQPDPRVVYSFPHADVPLTLVNSMEMVLLLGLPVVLMTLPGLIRTTYDVKWVVRAFVGLGMLYALGTIFAGQLGLNSQEVILDNARPQVFVATSSILGMMLVFFACIAMSHALYAQTRAASFCWWLCTIIFSIAVLLSFGREAWIALLLAGLTIFGLRTRNIAIPLLLLLVFVPFLFIPGVANFFNPEKVYGIDRLIMWQDAIVIWQHHPYFGIGAGNYQFFDIAYGIDVGGVAHNQFLEVLAEMGVPGLLCLLWSFAAIGRFALRSFNAATTAQGKAIALAYLGYYTTVIFGGFFTDSFLPSVAGAGGTFPLINASYHWLLLGLVLTIPQWEKSAPAQDTIEPGQAVKEQTQPVDSN